MIWYDWAQVLLLAVVTISLVPLLGGYIATIFEGKRIPTVAVLGWLEGACYRASGVNHKDEMSWREYLCALLLFNFFGLITLFLLLVLQHHLPLNPQGFPSLSWSLAFNTAVSFVTNTNWQAYAGESTLSYTSQMIGLAVQNFLSAATGLCIAVVLMRGIIRREKDTIGNFWRDLTGGVVYLLLPLSLLMAIFLVSQGVIQNFLPYLEVHTLEGAKQTIAMGPVASQVAIKQLGTNGGGFFNANSAHPFENPTFLTNFVETLALLLIPAALTYTYGSVIGSKRHGWLIFSVMFFLWVLGLGISLWAEYAVNPTIEVYPLLEGKETRFGVAASTLWSVSTTATSSGSVNAMLSSLSPLSGGVAMMNIVLGEVIFGGVGVGMAGMIMFILLTVFLCGLMVGRTPEYMGKKIEKTEVQWVMIALLVPMSLLLVGAGISSVHPSALASLSHQGPHGLSEILYAFASASGNNGSAFGGLDTNTTYFNIILGLVMLLARLAIIVPSIAIAGSLAKKKAMSPSLGTFSTNTALFMILLVSVILIFGALTFLPALSLGPIVEHLLMLKGRSF